MRKLIGGTDSSVVEFVDHLGASVAFALAVPKLRDAAPSLSPVHLPQAIATAVLAERLASFR